MNQVQMAAMLYDARDTMKMLHRGEGEYAEIVNQYQGYIEKVEKERSCDALTAVMAIIKENDVTGVGKLRLFAAYVELIEPSKAPTAA